jgi:hypothetical protein
MRRYQFTSLMLFCVTFAVFSRVLVADFVQWDDDISVYQNPYIKGLDWGRLGWMFSDARYAMRYEPLNWLGYALIYHFCGLEPFGYHFTSLVFHCLNVVLVFAVIRRLLSAAEAMGTLQDRLEQATVPAALGSLLWAINPLRVEPIAHATDLRYCLLVFFLMVSLWCYLRANQSADQASGASGVGGFYGCSVAAFALSMLSLPFASAYGLVLVVLDWYPLRRFQSYAAWWLDAKTRGILLEKVPFLLWGGIVLTTFVTRLNPTGIWVGAGLNHGFSFFDRGMQAFYVWAYYLWKPWAPFHLSPVYPTLLHFNPNHWPFWMSATLVAGLTLLLLWERRRWPWALALWASHLVLLVPALGLTERPHFTSDRYDYLPGLVWAVIIAAALWKLRTRPKLLAAGTAFAIAVAAFWGGLSFHQTRKWQNSVTLFEYMIRELGNNAYRSDIHWRLGEFYAEHGRPDRALQQYKTSLSIQPSFQPYQLLGELLEESGNAQAALTNYLAALRFRPDPAVHHKVGLLLCGLGRNAEAISHYRQALELDPDQAATLNNLAWMLATDNDAKNRSGAEAVQLAERVCSLTGHQVPLSLGTLAAAYAEAGRFREAVETAQTALDVAATAGEQQLAERYRNMLELYRSGRPYRLSSAAPVK